jgi:hypothetical protein
MCIFFLMYAFIHKIHTLICIYIKYKRQRPTTTIVITVRRYFTSQNHHPSIFTRSSLNRYLYTTTPTTSTVTIIIVIVVIVVVSIYIYAPRHTRIYMCVCVCVCLYIVTIHVCTPYPILPLFDIAPMKNETMSNHTHITRRTQSRSAGVPLRTHDVLRVPPAIIAVRPPYTVHVYM